MLKNIKKWGSIIRPRTLPVSMASVIMAIALSFVKDEKQWLPAAFCLLFAVLAQIVSNLANDYADYKTGSDNENSLGPGQSQARRRHRLLIQAKERGEAP